MIHGRAWPPAVLTAATVLGLVACTRSRATSSAGETRPARAVFLSTPDAVPTVVREIADEFPNNPPAPRATPLLIAAARTGFSASTFDRAFAAAPPPGAAPDDATKPARHTRARAHARVTAGAHPAPADAPAAQAVAIAPMLPAIAAAREQGLALDRINLLVEATRDNPDVVRAMTPSVLASSGADVMIYSRDNVVQEDATWGGHLNACVARAKARAAAALRLLTPKDLATLRRWYAAPAGRAEVARLSSTLAQAYDAAGAATTKDYYRRLQADRISPGAVGSSSGLNR